MSKYIRTKEGIIYVGDLIKDEYGNYCDTKNYETDMEVSAEYIIKEADTIEELCDEFVIHNFSYYKKPYIPTSQINIKAIPIETFIKCDMQLYGAIWTDKGLIYVAKMNDKGDLELI